MKFGEKLRTLRKEKNLKQEELAKQIGVSTRTIISYENNKSYPRRMSTYKQLADALGCEENYLRTENEDFITSAMEKYGSKGAAQAKAILEQAAALFAGGELSDEDEMAFMYEMQSLYFDSKERAKKFTPKKYLTKDTND